MKRHRHKWGYVAEEYINPGKPTEIKDERGTVYKEKDFFSDTFIYWCKCGTLKLRVRARDGSEKLEYLRPEKRK